MADAEFVAGDINGVIRKLDSARKIYNSRKEAASLRKAFRAVSTELTLVHDTLTLVEQQIKASNPSEEACDGLEPIIKACEGKATALEKLFRKCVPKGKASTQERYIKVVQTLGGRDHMIEVLMKGLLENVQRLAGNNAVKLVPGKHTKQLTDAIKRMSKMEPSVPGDTQKKPVGTFNNYGDGPQIAHAGVGDQNTNAGSGKMFVGQSQVFHEAVQK